MHGTRLLDAGSRGSGLSISGSLNQRADPPKRRSELVRIIGGGIFELLEEAVDGGADFRRVGGLGFTAVGDIERVHRHGGLFRSALVGERDIFRIFGNTLEDAQSK